MNSFNNNSNGNCNLFENQSYWPSTFSMDASVSPSASNSSTTSSTFSTSPSGSSASWSPFSTPLFSPYDVSSVCFQYSSAPAPPCQPPQTTRRLICKTNAKTSSNSNSSDTTSYANAVRCPPSPCQPIPINQQQQQHQQRASPTSAFGMPSPPSSSSSSSSASSACMTSSLPKRSEQIDMSDIIRHAAIQRALGGRVKLCTFCKTNGESEAIYTSHSLKDSNDKITCPILMRYACPVCGATGEQTHTKKYCPVLQKKLRHEMLKKVTMALN